MKQIPKPRKKGHPSVARGLVHQDYPEGLVKIAKSRIGVHLHNMRLVDYNIEQLLLNVYLQAIHDLAVAQASQQSHPDATAQANHPTIVTEDDTEIEM